MTTPNLRTLAACLALTLALPLASADTLLGPGAPQDLAAAAGPGAGALSLSWTAASSLTGVTAYRVYLVHDDGSLALAAELPADALAWSEAGLAPGVTRTYAVSAVDLTGEGPLAGPVSATTFDVPDAPAGVHVTAGPGPVGEALVSWTAPASDGGLAITAYRVYRDGALVATVPGDATTWTDAGLQPLHAYGYQVSAVNDAGESMRSEAACGMASPWVAELGCQTVA